MYCLIAGGLYLAVVTVILEAAAKALKVSRDVPPSIFEPPTSTWQILNFIMEFLFFVMVPTFGYALFFVVLPLSGVRTGLATALCVFTLGAVPAVVGLSVRLRLPTLYLLYFLFGLLVKLAGSLALIGYLYTL